MSISNTKRFTVLALLAAIAITLNILETAMIPPLMGVFRIGLANIMALVALRMLGVKEMLIVNAMRVLIGNLLTGTIFGSVFWISLAGVVLSSLILILMDLLKSSLMFTSVMSSIGHSFRTGVGCYILLYAASIYRCITLFLIIIYSNRFINWICSNNRYPACKAIT